MYFGRIPSALGDTNLFFSWGLWLDETCPSYGAQLKSHKSIDFDVILTKKKKNLHKDVETDSWADN